MKPSTHTHTQTVSDSPLSGIALTLAGTFSAQIFAELTEHFNQLDGSRFHAFTHSLPATHFAGCFHFAEGGHISSIIVNGGSLQGNLFGGDLPEQMFFVLDL